MQIAPDVFNEIARTLLRVRQPSKVSRLTGYDIEVVLEVADEIKEKSVQRPERHGGFGRPEMQRYIVARTRAGESWDNTDLAIALARQNFELGTHTMSTGRDGDWMILYSIPLRKVSPKPGYFRPEV